MKQTVTVSFVRAMKGKRHIKIFTENLKRIYKVEKRILPSVPSFQDKFKSAPITDSEDNLEEISLIWDQYPKSNNDVSIFLIFLFILSLALAFLWKCQRFHLSFLLNLIFLIFFLWLTDSYREFLLS